MILGWKTGRFGLLLTKRRVESMPYKKFLMRSFKKMKSEILLAFPPVIANSDGVPKLVSVPVSVLDLVAPNSLLRMQLEMEARVGIGRITPSTSHSKSTV